MGRYKAGLQEGEVTPLFAIGTSLGAAVAGIMGLPQELVAAMGYAIFSYSNILF